jgi:hypothetical protein
MYDVSLRLEEIALYPFCLKRQKYPFFYKEKKKKNPIKIPNQLIIKNFWTRKLVLRINVNDSLIHIAFFNFRLKDLYPTAFSTSKVIFFFFLRDHQK